MAYKISGRVLHIGPSYTINSKSGASHTKRDLIISVRRFDPNTGQPTDDPRNTPIFSFFNDKCQQLDRVKVGDVVVVDFSLFGRTYDKDGRTEYINDVSPNSVYVDRGQSGQPNYQTQPQSQSANSQPQPASTQPPQQTFPNNTYSTHPFGQTATTQAPIGPQGSLHDPF